MRSFSINLDEASGWERTSPDRPHSRKPSGSKYAAISWVTRCVWRRDSSPPQVLFSGLVPCVRTDGIQGEEPFVHKDLHNDK